MEEILKQQRKEIESLLGALVSVQDSLDKHSHTDQISWANDLYDEVTVGFLKQRADGDFQTQLENEGFVMDYIDAKRSILDRIKKMIEGAEEELWKKQAA